MQYRNLGRSGLKISPICLGTMMFGGPTDEATSSRIVAKAREAGINFIDTADAYNGGNSEAVVGRAISNNRHNWILATKLANQIGDDPNRGGLFVLEAVSVIVQVVSFKLTGKRVFRMAPIHHHFELKGWPEPRVIVRFWIISVVLVLVGLASLKVR